MTDWPTIFAILAAISLALLVLFLILSAGQKRRGGGAGEPSYSLFAWLALITAVFFVFMTFVTFEMTIM